MVHPSASRPMNELWKKLPYYTEYVRRKDTYPHMQAVFDADALQVAMYDVDNCGRLKFDSDDFKVLGPRCANVMEQYIVRENGEFYSRGPAYHRVTENARSYAMEDMKNEATKYLGHIEKLDELLHAERDSATRRTEKKMQFLLNDHLLNLFGWNLWVAYRDTILCKNKHIKPSTLTDTEHLLCYASDMQVLLSNAGKGDLQTPVKKIRNTLDELPKTKEEDYISHYMQGVGERNIAYRVREGCNEFENMLHGYSIARSIEEGDKDIDTVVGVLLGGLTSGCIASSMINLYTPIVTQFMYMVYSREEPHLNRHENNINEAMRFVPKQLHDLWSRVYGQRTLIVDDSIFSGRSMKKCVEMCNHFSVDEPATTVVELSYNALDRIGAESAKDGRKYANGTKYEMCISELNFPPTFKHVGSSPKERVWKNVERGLVRPELESFVRELYGHGSAVEMGCP